MNFSTGTGTEIEMTSTEFNLINCDVNIQDGDFNIVHGNTILLEMSATTINSSSLANSGTSIVTADSGGTLTVISPYIISSSTTANLLENISNWNIDAKYTGSTITGTYQGQKHYNPSYFFEAVEDNLFIRFKRG